MKRRTIITSVLVIVLCLGLISGSTFALFTSESSVNIAVTSGKVKLTAELDDEPTLYSADATLTTGTLVDKIDPSDTTGTILTTDAQGTFAGTYYYQEQQNGTFANGGTATVGTDGAMTIARMTPGDKVVAKLLVKNESNVAIKYRLKITATATDSTVLNSDKILDVLKVKFEGKLYNGLKEFSSAWIAKAAATTTETYESAVEIILPLDVAGDAYQDNDVKLTFTVEAVQGNAKTVDIVTAATTAVVTGATTKLVVPTSPLAEANTNTEVELTNVGTTNQTVKLTVETVEYDTSNTPTSYNVLSNDQAAVASVDLKLLVDDQAVTAFESGASAKITTYVIKGLDDISVVYNGDADKAFGTSSTTTSRVITSEADVNQVGEYYYDATTGKLVFVTDHFSEYVPATKDNLEALNVTTNTVYKSLVTAINNVTANDEVLILKDVTYDRVTITKSMTLDGGNHTLTDNNTSGRAIWIDDTDVVFTLKNLTIDGANKCERGLQVNVLDNEWNNATIIMDNCVLKNLTYYAVNFCSKTTVNMTITNSSISGWAALNAYGTGNTITAINSEFIGINDKSYDGWNNFATICLEGDTTGQTEDHSADYTITFTNCNFKASQTTGNKQSILGYNDNAENSSVTFTNCKFDIGEGCYFYYNKGNTENPNTLIIDGEVVNMIQNSFQNLAE